jgi:hypothetical protein
MVDVVAVTIRAAPIVTVAARIVLVLFMSSSPWLMPSYTGG